jgi:prepilin peptidase CpaA
LITALLTFVVACCAVDVRIRRIPNAISAPAIVIGVAINGLYFGPAGLLASTGGIMVMVGVLIVPFALGGIGAGDVKMMAAVGAFLGPRLAVLGLALGMGVGGIIMGVHLVRLGRLTEKIRARQEMISSALVMRSIVPLRVAADDPGAISLPYSVPLGLGTAAAIVAAVAFGA